jgi:hypothetical protein
LPGWSLMELLSLIAERSRVAEAFRATTTYIVMLRSHLTRSDLTEEVRRELLPIIEEETAESHRLSEELLHIDVAILKLQASPDVPLRLSPLDLAPVVF